MIRAWFVVAVLTMPVVWDHATHADDQPTDGAKTRAGRALLVACSDYEQDGITDLRGPENDVVEFEKMLVDRFGFSPASIVVLSAGSGLPATRRNIEKELETLAQTAAEGEQIVVLLSGHGGQQPDAAPFDEADGFDEVFCPVDVSYLDAAGSVAVGGILDDDIGVWLTRISNRRANVWLIADSCHNGTLSRAGGIPRAAAPLNPLKESVREDERHETPQGRIVAFYASPPTHKTYETTVDGVPHGLFTHTICHVLNQASGQLTYRRLIERVYEEYRSEGRRHPTPQMETQFRDTVVLGTAQMRDPDIRIARTGEGFQINAGRLRRVAEGTVLAVFTNPQDPSLIGYVRITDASPVSATAIPCRYQDVAWPDDVRLEQGFCEIAHASYQGLRRIAVAVDDINVDGASLPADVKHFWVQQLADMARPPTGDPALFTVADRPADADWLIRPTGFRPEEGEAVALSPTERFQHQITDEGLIVSPPDFDPSLWLKLKLTDIARSCNLVEVAGLDRQHSAAQIRVDVQLRSLRDESDFDGVAFSADTDPTGQPGRVLHPGTMVGVHVSNPNDFPVYVSVLLVDSAFRTELYFPEQAGQAGHLLAARGNTGSEMMTARMKLTDERFGQDSFVVIAEKHSPLKAPTDLSFLDSSLRSSKGTDGNSALADLLETTVVQGRHSKLSGSRDNQLLPYTMRVISWNTLPDQDDEKGFFDRSAENLKAKVVVEGDTRYHTANRSKAFLGSYGRLIRGNQWIRRPHGFDPRGTIDNLATVGVWPTRVHKKGKTSGGGLLSFVGQDDAWKISGSAGLSRVRTVEFELEGKSLKAQDLIPRLNQDQQAVAYFKYLQRTGAVPCVILNNILMTTCKVNGSVIFHGDAEYALTGATTKPRAQAALLRTERLEHKVPIIRCYELHAVIMEDGRVVDLKPIAP